MTIREAWPDDAEQIIAHVQRLAEETNITLPLAPGEFHFTMEQERNLLAEYMAADNSLFIVAEVEGQIVGVLTCDVESAEQLVTQLPLGCRSQKSGETKALALQ
jgi:hypothetical protein